MNEQKNNHLWGGVAQAILTIFINGSKFLNVSIKGVI